MQFWCSCISVVQVWAAHLGSWRKVVPCFWELKPSIYCSWLTPVDALLQCLLYFFRYALQNSLVTANGSWINCYCHFEAFSAHLWHQQGMSFPVRLHHCVFLDQPRDGCEWKTSPFRNSQTITEFNWHTTFLHSASLKKLLCPLLASVFWRLACSRSAWPSLQVYMHRAAAKELAD